MRRFSPDGQRVHVFDQITGKFRFSGTKRIAAEIDFYTLTNKDGGTERWIESRLAEIDAAVGIFDKLERGDATTREERWRVSFYLGFADYVAPVSAALHHLSLHATIPMTTLRSSRDLPMHSLPRQACTSSRGCSKTWCSMMSLISPKVSTRTA